MRRVWTLTASLATAGVLAAGVAGLAQQGSRGGGGPGPIGQGPAAAETIQKTSEVADLVGWSAHTWSKGEFDMAPLVELITSTVAPGTWTTVNEKGDRKDEKPGAIMPFPINGNLIIQQTPRVHAQIADRLTQLRRFTEAKQKNEGLANADAAPLTLSRGSGMSGMAAGSAFPGMGAAGMMGRGMSGSAPAGGQPGGIGPEVPGGNAASGSGRGMMGGGMAGMMDMMGGAKPGSAPAGGMASGMKGGASSSSGMKGGASSSGGSGIMSGNKPKMGGPGGSGNAAMNPGSQPTPGQSLGGAAGMPPGMGGSGVAMPGGPGMSRPGGIDPARAGGAALMEREGETERRLRALEEKLDRVLKALDVPKDKTDYQKAGGLKP